MLKLKTRDIRRFRNVPSSPIRDTCDLELLRSIDQDDPWIDLDEVLERPAFSSYQNAHIAIQQYTDSRFIIQYTTF